MNNQGKHHQDSILEELRNHLLSMPETKPKPIYPDCHCMNLFGGFVRRGIIAGPRFCLCCTYFLGRFMRRKDKCPFIE